MKQIPEGTPTPLEDEGPGSDSYWYDSELHELLKSLSTDLSKAISLEVMLGDYQSQIMTLLDSIEDAANRPLG